jgi:regulator of protease activity HflC (stomatin/prohibitin superfamily)
VSTIIFLAVIGLLAVAALVASIKATKPAAPVPNHMGRTPKAKPNPKLIFGAVAAAFATLFLLVLVFQSVKIVGAREVGVKLQFGAIQQDTVKPGFHIVPPWVDVEKVSTVPQTSTVKPQVRSSENGRIAPTLLVRWQVSADNAADLYTQIRNSRVDGDTEEKIFAQLVNPAISGAAGSALGAKQNLEIVNGKEWPANASSIQGFAAPDLATVGIVLQSTRQTAAEPDETTELAIQRSAAQQVETNIAKEADKTAKEQAKRNLTEATGLLDAANKLKGLTPAQVDVLCLQAAERIMNKNQEKGIPTYALPCQTGGASVIAK